MKIKALKTFKWNLNLPQFEKDKIYDINDNLGIEMIDHNYAIAIKHEDESHKSIKTVFENKMEHLEKAEDKKADKNKIFDISDKLKKENKKSKNKFNKKRNKSVK